MNPADIFALKGHIDTLQNNHPRLFQFLGAAKEDAMQEGSIIEVKVTNPEGKVLTTNIKVQASDVAALQTLSSLTQRR
ncbi:MAG: hypothetical protein PHC41_14240 [Lachnospiraceae bacterium]|jgi:hypothetical protein|nr:hypothetical protein [Lachnospiraceae bacterium]MDD3617365.1 hypothetical protein [Lachnospiraceae bacterium]